MARQLENHGDSKGGIQTSEYRTWAGIIQRCYNVNIKNYHRYGRRGITVCDRWRYSFAAFLEDMGRRPGPEYTLERINNHGNYDPSNCTWATQKEQARNRRSNRLITYNNETHIMKEWAEIIGISYKTLSMRFYNGWSIKDALTTPVR